jgi:hypothetical protein
VALDDAQTKLAAEDPVKGQLVTLRYFAGLRMQIVHFSAGASGSARFALFESRPFSGLRPGPR